MKLHLRTFKIITDRLVIRCYKETDAAMLKQSIDESIEDLKHWVPWTVNEPETVQDKEKRIKRFVSRFQAGEDYTFAIFNLRENELLGSTGLHARLEKGAMEIGYWVNIRHSGRGIATETVRALTKVGFEIERLHRLEIHCDPENVRSARVAERCMYELREIQKNKMDSTNGDIFDSMIWQMTKEKYFLNPVQLKLQCFDISGNRIV